MIYDCCGGDGQHKVLCPGPRREPGMKLGEAFHRHLDICVRCERAPFDLCAEGQRLLAREASTMPPTTPNLHVDVEPADARVFASPAERRSMLFVLRPDGAIEPCPDPGAWSVWCEDHGSIRVVATTRFFGNAVVTTSFTGLDASFGASEDPMVFETAIFGGPESGRRIFASNAGDAMLNHVDAEQLLRTRDQTHAGSRTLLGRRSYPSDDRDLDGCDHELHVFSGENGDWYVSIVRRGEVIGPHVRVTTSGSPRGREGVAVAIAALYRALGASS